MLQLSRPSQLRSWIFFCCSEPIIIEGPDYTNYTCYRVYEHYIDVRGEVLPTSRGTMTPVAADTRT